MPERGIWRGASQRGYATVTNAPLRVDSTSNAVLVNPSATGTTEVTLTVAGSASGNKMTAGNASFVSGAATIATGLTTVLSVQIMILATGFATGATEISDAVVSSITTGSVAIQGYRLQTTTASASGTGVFYWLAVGV